MSAFAVGVMLTLSACTANVQGPPAKEQLIGEWGSSDPLEPAVVFTADGGFLASNMCQLSGTWTLDGAVVAFAVSGATGMRCGTPNFEKLATATLRGDELALRDAQGAEIVAIKKRS